MKIQIIHYMMRIMGNNNGTNLSGGSIYESLNSGKLLNIYNNNKVRYLVYNFGGDYNNPQGSLITTSYSNDIFKFSNSSTSTNNELYDIANQNTNVYIKLSGYFSPQDTGYYRLVSNPTDDGIRLRIREFTTASDIENDDSSSISIVRIGGGTSYFRYDTYDGVNFQTSQL